jgi:hypothetical protein
MIKWIIDFESARWKLDKYMEWMTEMKVVDQYPLFKFYLERLEDKASIERFNRLTLV